MSELGDDVDRYDYPKVWPSPRQLHMEFSILAAINALTATFVLVLMLSILMSPKVRNNAFQLYILSIAFPDFMAAFLCLWTCSLSAPRDEFFSEWMCGFQSFGLDGVLLDRVPTQYAAGTAIVGRSRHVRHPA